MKDEKIKKIGNVCDRNKTLIEEKESLELRLKSLDVLQGRITCSIWFVLLDARRVTDDIRICYTNSLPVVVMITVRLWFVHYSK